MTVDGNARVRNTQGMAGINHLDLVKAMEKSGMTIKQLADECGISIQYANDITKGRRRLKRRPDLIKQMAQALDVPTHWIAQREAS